MPLLPLRSLSLPMSVFSLCYVGQSLMPQIYCWLHFTVGSAILVGLQTRSVQGGSRVQGMPGQLAWLGRGSRPPLLPQPALCLTDPAPAWPDEPPPSASGCCASVLLLGHGTAQTGLSRTLLRAAPVTLTMLWSCPSPLRQLGGAGSWWLPSEVCYFAFVKTEAVIYLPTADSSAALEPSPVTALESTLGRSPEPRATPPTTLLWDVSAEQPLPQGPCRGGRGDPRCTQTSPAVSQRHLLPHVPVPERPHRPHGHCWRHQSCTVPGMLAPHRDPLPDRPL